MRKSAISLLCFLAIVFLSFDSHAGWFDDLFSGKKDTQPKAVSDHLKYGPFPPDSRLVISVYGAPVMLYSWHVWAKENDCSFDISGWNRALEVPAGHQARIPVAKSSAGNDDDDIVVECHSDGSWSATRSH